MKTKTVEVTIKDLKRIIKLCDKAMDGIEEYAETLEDTSVIRDPLYDVYDMIENLIENGKEK